MQTSVVRLVVAGQQIETVINTVSVSLDGTGLLVGADEIGEAVGDNVRGLLVGVEEIGLLVGLDDGLCVGVRLTDKEHVSV